MKRTLRIICLGLALAVLLTACGGGSGGETTADSGSQSQVEDIFTRPPATGPAPVTDGTTDPTEEPDNALEVGSISHGFSDRSMRDDLGYYQVYSGGEIHVGYHICFGGTLGNQGIGLLFFLDGQPQPYKLSEDGEYRYLHVIYPKENIRTEYEIIFAPVTGKQGDTLELYATHVLYPDYFPSHSVNGFAQTFTSIVSGTRLVFEADPPQRDFPDVFDRVLDSSVSYVDLTSAETVRYTEEELRTESFYNFLINGYGKANQSDYSGPGTNPSIICNISPDEPLHISFSLFGCPYAEYELTVFIDHVPVHIDLDKKFSLQAKNGQKCVVEMDLDMSDFDGDAVIYAVLCIKNHFPNPEVENCYTEVMTARYLSDAATVEEMLGL